MSCHPAREKPQLFIITKNQIGNFPVDDVVFRIPIDIATTKSCFSRLAVHEILGSDPVFGLQDFDSRYDASMARPLRIEYPNAIYHVMSWLAATASRQFSLSKTTIDGWSMGYQRPRTFPIEPSFFYESRWGFRQHIFGRRC